MKALKIVSLGFVMATLAFVGTQQTTVAVSQNNEDQASSINRISIATLEAYSHSQTDGDYRDKSLSDRDMEDMMTDILHLYSCI